MSLTSCLCASFIIPEDPLPITECLEEDRIVGKLKFMMKH